MEIDVRWRRIRNESDEAWDWLRVLYAYLDPRDGEIFYVGKAHGCSVRQRRDSADKDALFDFMAEHGVTNPLFLVGDLACDRRYSKELLADVESLLIKRLRPRGNIQCTRTRSISRPGMRVFCHGPSWPARSAFHDRG